VTAPSDAPAENGDGDVKIKVTYETDWGECTVEGTLTGHELEVLFVDMGVDR
jgi:hypothetical protein